MGIIGLTHDSQGASLQRLPVRNQSLDRSSGPDPDQRARSTRSALITSSSCRKVNRGQDVVWEADPRRYEGHAGDLR